VNGIPPEAEQLLATRPEDFVAERTALARSLRDDGRAEDAAAVASLRKPPAVVLAVNRAARDRPQAARDAADAAARLARAQLRGEREQYETAGRELENALELLVEVALAQLGRDRPPTESTRVRVRDLVRAAVSDESARDLLVRGALTTEVESTGFGAFAGMEMPTLERGGGSATKARQGTGARARARKRELQQQVRETRRALRAAEKDVRAAEQRRDELSEALSALEAELQRL
jgi:hypothetical protein